jgi:ABC-type protease/lipase transport system fused ATPase/permease subunit
MSLRNSEVLQAMGMMPGLLQRWDRDRSRALERQIVASDRAASNASLVRFLRLSMQSLMLGLGAYLVIDRLATVGAMFAAGILLGRALQPVEQIVGTWRNMISARNAFDRVKKLLAANPLRDPALTLPRPAGRLSVEGLVYSISRAQSPILRGISFRLNAGEVLGIIGPSGAGKSTLARQIVGVLPPSVGAVRRRRCLDLAARIGSIPSTAKPSTASWWATYRYPVGFESMRSGSRLEDPNALGMSGLVSLLMAMRVFLPRAAWRGISREAEHVYKTQVR